MLFQSNIKIQSCDLSSLDNLMYPGTSVQCKAKQQQQLQNCGSFDLIEGYRNFVTVHTCRLLLNNFFLKFDIQMEEDSYKYVTKTSEDNSGMGSKPLIKVKFASIEVNHRGIAKCF